MKPTPAEMLKFEPVSISAQMPPIDSTITLANTTATSSSEPSARYSSTRISTSDTATTIDQPVHGLVHLLELAAPLGRRRGL